MDSAAELAPNDTIAAIATAPGGAAHGMVRISGPQVVPLLGNFFEVKTAGGLAIDQARQPTAFTGNLRIVLDEGAPYSIPCDLFLWPTHRSYTREPVAELHTLGSPPLLQGVLETVCRAGARLAEPGEFTLRAFLAGRIDLTQAEAVLGVIDAGDADELEVALVQLAGGMARPLGHLREELLQILAELEAGLDFVEEDIEFLSKDQLLKRLSTARELLHEIGGQMTDRVTALAAPRIVLFGLPNVGKSSLFNALVRTYGLSEASPAIVSEKSGTTRDYLTQTLDLDGLRCELVDTAGTQLPLSSIATDAQAMTTQQQQHAAVRVLCIEATAAPTDNPSADIVVITKADLLSEPSGHSPILTSSLTGEGIDRLGDALRNHLSGGPPNAQTHGVAATADRCRESLRLAEEALARAAEVVTATGGDELVAIELREALHGLGKVVGAIYTDDLLDRIFSTFCIGK